MGFRPFARRWRASLSPKTAWRLLQLTNDARARVAGSRTSFRSRGDASPRDRSLAALPLAESRHERRAAPGAPLRRRLAQTDPSRAKARSAFRRRVPSSLRTAHPSVTRSFARRAEPLRAGDERVRRRPLAGPPPFRLPVPRLPAKGDAFVENRGAFNRRAFVRDVEIAPPARPTGPPVHATRDLRRGREPLRPGEPTPFSAGPRARCDAPSTRIPARIARSNGGRFRFPPSRPIDSRRP